MGCEYCANYKHYDIEDHKDILKVTYLHWGDKETREYITNKIKINNNNELELKVNISNGEYNKIIYYLSYIRYCPMCGRKFESY